MVLCVSDTGALILLYADDTKIYRIVNCIEDMEQLQRAIDNLAEWSRLNKLQLNVTKTYHVSFTKRKEIRHTSHYYLGTQRIAKKDEVKDLGVLFDRKLTFVPHVDAIILKSNKIYAMDRRFGTDIGCNRLILKIVSTYITPLIEYCSVVWDQERVLSNKRLEKFVHNATRFALHTPFRTDDIDYVSFEKRMELCGLLTYEERRKIASAIFTVKLHNNTIDTNLGDFVRDSRHESVFHSRSPLLFTIRRSLSDSSPLHRCFRIINAHRDIINIDETVETTKSKLKTFFAFSRTLRNT